MATRNKTTADICDLFSVDESTVTRWIADGLPCDKGGRGKPRFFDEAEVAAWMQANKRTGKPGRPTTEDGDELKALKIRKELALVLKYERENAIQDGKLIDAAAEQQRDVQKIVTLRNRLSGLGASISPSLDGLDGAERQTVIDQAINTILTEFGKE